MSDQSEVIRKEMESTRRGLSEKIQALENTVVGKVEKSAESTTDAVENVTDKVEDTVESVGDAVTGSIETMRSLFDVPKQFEERPWAAMGTSVGVGAVVGMLFGGSTPAQGAPQASSGNTVRSTDGTKIEEPSLLEEFVPEAKQLKSLAVGSLIGVLRDMVTQPLQGKLKSGVTDTLNNVIAKLGGKPGLHPVDMDGNNDSTSEKGDSNGQSDETEMGRPMGTAQRPREVAVGPTHR